MLVEMVSENCDVTPGN